MSKCMRCGATDVNTRNGRFRKSREELSKEKHWNDNYVNTSACETCHALNDIGGKQNG